MYLADVSHVWLAGGVSLFVLSFCQRQWPFQELFPKAKQSGCIEVRSEIILPEQLLFVEENRILGGCYPLS